MNKVLFDGQVNMNWEVMLILKLTVYMCETNRMSHGPIRGHLHVIYKAKYLHYAYKPCQAKRRPHIAAKVCRYRPPCACTQFCVCR